MNITFNPPKDGSCQFNCLAKELKALGFVWSHDFLRSELTNWLRHANIVEVTASVPDNDISKYLSNMEIPTTFGDNVTLFAAARRFNVQIVVLSSAGERYTCVISPDSSDKFNSCAPTILLGHYPEGGGEHYVCLGPRAGFNITDIVTSRRKSIVPLTPATGELSNDMNSTQTSSSLTCEAASSFCTNDYEVEEVGNSPGHTMADSDWQCCKFL